MFPGPSRHPGVGPSPVSVKLINRFNVELLRSTDS